MSGTGDDDKKSFGSTEEKRKGSTPKQKTVRGTVKHGQKGEHAKGNVHPDPHKKSEDPGLPSTTHGDLPAASALPALSKSKAVRIKLKPKIIKEHASSAPGRFLSSPIAERYEWKSYLFHEPKKSAMKPTTDQLPNAPSELPLPPPNVPSGTVPIELPNLLEPAVTQSKTTSVSSNVTSTMSSMQSKLTDQSALRKASVGLLKHAGITQSTSVKNVTSAMPNVPTSAKLPKVTGASTLPSVTVKDSTKLPPIPSKDASVNLPAQLSAVESKRTSLSKQQTKLPPIERPLRRSPTWPPTKAVGAQLPPILPKDSTKESFYSITDPPPGYVTVVQRVLPGWLHILGYAKLPSEEHDSDTTPPKIAKKKPNLTIQISPQVSPEEARKEIVKPVNIAKEDPEIVSDYDLIKLWK